MYTRNNIIFIGMAGAGKTTIAKAYAKQYNMSYIDTDDILHNMLVESVEKTVEKYGDKYILQCEEDICSQLETANTVIATSGSTVYSENAMHHLQQLGIIVFLDCSFDVIQHRINSPEKRGVIGIHNKTLKELYQERIMLYRKYADITVRTDIETEEQTVLAIHNKIGKIN